MTNVKEVVARLGKVQGYHTRKANRHKRAASKLSPHEEEFARELMMAQAVREAKDLIKSLEKECAESRKTVRAHRKLVRAFERTSK